MADRLTPEELRELTEGRQRMIERLSSEQVAELAEQRRSRMAQLSEDEFGTCQGGIADLLSRVRC